MPRHEQILIGVSPTALRVAVLVGRRLVRVERVALNPAEWSEAWSKGLRPFDLALSGALAAIGIAPGASATVVYGGPDTFVDLCSVPASGAAAFRAAELGLRESVRDDKERLSVFEVAEREKAGAGEPSRTHVLVQSESAAHAAMLSSFTERAGLRCVGLLPARAAFLRVAMDHARSIEAAQESSVVVWMEDHATILLARHGGRLRFARAVDMGYWQLADAIVRGAASAGMNVERSQAYRLLATAGVPRRGQMVDQTLGLRAEQVLPLMQSVLQRYVVEIKQTLRFGLPEGDLARASVRLAGPGIQVPGLCEHFAGELDCAVTVPDPERRAAGPSPETSSQDPGELLTAAGLLGELKSILPPGERVRRDTRHAKMALAAGVVMSLSLVGADWWFATQRLADLEAKIAQLAPRVEAVKNARDARAHAAALASEVAAGERMIAQVVGHKPGWSAVLNDLSHVTPASIDLAEVTATYAKDGLGGPGLTVRGMASQAPGVSPDDVLAQFLNQLSKCPLVESARVVSTRAERAGGTGVKQFVIGVQLRSLPDAAWRAAQAEGERP